MREASLAPAYGLGAETTSGWLEEIPEDLTYEQRNEDGGSAVRPLREHPQIREFRNPGELARAFLETKRLVGQKTVGLAPLGKDATPEERKAWDRELRKLTGVPDTPDAYEFDAAPQGLKPDDDMLAWYRGQAHKAGLSPAQAGTLYEAWNAYMLGRLQAETKAQAEMARQALTQEWGKDLLPNVELARRGFMAAAARAGFSEPEAVAAIDQSGFGDHPLLVRLFHAIGQDLAEDELVAGHAGQARARSAAEVLYPSMTRS